MSSSVTDNSLTTLSRSDLELLKQRAIRFAKRVDDKNEKALEVILFLRGGTTYGVLVKELREIRPLRQFCHIPGASKIVPGVLYYRGEILSVHDLLAFMDESASGSIPAWVLIAESTSGRFGLLADDVFGVEPISNTKIKPVPITLGERGTCFNGVTQEGVMILNLEALVASRSFFYAL
jgi:purine-binding chemotaxis protein CheW